MKRIVFLLLLALTLFVAAAGAPEGWKWDKGGTARADDGVPQCDPAVATCADPAPADPAPADPAPADPAPADPAPADPAPADPAPCDQAVATCDDQEGDDPDGWSWNDLPDGWSWNRAEIVATGTEVTLAADGSSVAVAAPVGAAPMVGDTVEVVYTGDDTLLGFPTADGGIAWTALGWSWNE